MADEGGNQKVLTCSQSMKKRQSAADEGGNQKVLTCPMSPHATGTPEGSWIT